MLNVCFFIEILINNPHIRHFTGMFKAFVNTKQLFILKIPEVVDYRKVERSFDEKNFDFDFDFSFYLDVLK